VDGKEKQNMNTTVALDHPFLAGMNEQYRDMVLHGAHEQEFGPDEIICREGAPANTLYLIESGEVMLEAEDPGREARPIQTLEAGDVLGWSWLFPPFAWHFQARALKPTRVICCDGGHLLVEAEGNSAFGYDVMRRITRVLIQRLEAVRKKGG
jgi:CRP/FNR family transcriptional regulator, cyclic AMP receptor protein